MGDPHVPPRVGRALSWPPKGAGASGQGVRRGRGRLGRMTRDSSDWEEGVSSPAERGGAGRVAGNGEPEGGEAESTGWKGPGGREKVGGLFPLPTPHPRRPLCAPSPVRALGRQDRSAHRRGN
ncbi:unnamed protein product [Rangifer tarandus platyrhynchus]|uniref:Uncharacterized protein n=1 Tax=Rangifer tarandus platyrhynchus TaxID=3082113 RepID=A0AC59Z676_RANTA